MADDQHAVGTPAVNNGPHGFIPSFADAAKLVSAPYSCLVLETHRRHVGLAPMFMRRKRTGIQEELDAELLKYSESLNGVPSGVRPHHHTGPQGDICDDNGYVHMNIRPVLWSSTPNQDKNCGVPKPNLIPVVTWRDVGPRIGAELEFEVNQIDADQ
ncbi:hypothetical protein CRUP_023507, partial [Coryphaenoides rupestris]